MTDTIYRFLPWARRGLAASLPVRVDAGPLPQRGVVAVQVVVAGAGSATPSATLHGPGDVVGLDTTTIVRTFPRPGTSNAEPNLFAVIDFDPPDLPWAFTPTGPSGTGRLSPWLVLVVVEDRAGVSITVPRGAPLPQLHIASGASLELPDLAESWAWGHVQMLVPGGGVAVADELRAHPERNVSRLVAARRLRPNARWHACLVPAFDAGVIRGLGGTPPADRPLAPAWTNVDSLTLPLYFHWSFGTGPEGDFESLARRIRPHRASGDVGKMRMHIGAGSPAVALPEGDAERFLDMDGALRAPSQRDGTMAEVPARISAGLRHVAEIVADAADGTIGDGHSGGPADQPLGPPVYAAYHARRMRLDPTAPQWLRELNLDPRCRVAAGLGAEIVRVNQEDFVHAAWQQVGAVLAANELLSRARLALEASQRFHIRHLRPLPPDRMLQLAAPLSGRTRLAATTVRAAIRPTSLPDAVLDPALRRLAAPTSRLVSRVTRRLGVAPRSELVKHFAPGRQGIDPTLFAQPALRGRVAELGQLRLPIAPDAGSAAELSGRAAALQATPSPVDRLGLRDDLAATGLVGEAHVRAARRLAEVEGTPRGSDILGTLVAAAREHREAVGFRLARDGGTIRLIPVERGSDDPTARPEVVVPPGRVPPVDGGRAGPEVVVPPGRVPPVDGGQPGPVGIEVPPLVTDAAVLGRYRAALADVRASTFLSELAPVPRLVAYDLAGAGAALLARCDPAIANPARLATMVRFGDVPVTARNSLPPLFKVASLIDRVMAYPAFDVPVYEYLARHDRTRFVPGVDAIPSESITLLETNPRFVNAFLAGMNHEMGRELLWRGYPTDQRGSPFRRFWGRLDGSRDISEMHRWSAGTLTQQSTDGGAKLVLLVRGELLRRYPNTLVLARRAVDMRTPSTAEADLRLPIFTGTFEPDVSFFGFDLEDHQLTEGAGWFFALVEPIAEPRFGLDEKVDPARGTIDDWQEVAWPDVGTTPGGMLRAADLGRVSRALATPGDSAALAAALFQQPFELVVHAKHLVEVT